MNFQVPQFIEIEDKIFGPLSFRQFMYLVGGGGIAFLIYVIPVPLFIKAIPIIGAVALALALAFYKINQRPFIAIAESAIKYYLGNKLYLWKKEKPLVKKIKGIDAVIGDQRSFNVPKLSESKLKDLTWSLDVQKEIK